MYADLGSIGFKPWVPRLLCGLFVMFTLAELFWGSHAVLFADAPVLEETAAVVKSLEPVPLERTVLVNKPLFGDYIPDNLDEMDVKRSALQLSVIGIIYSSKEEESEVIIQLSDKDERVFHVGDDLPGGAILKRIQPEEIFMMRHGSIERLSLPEKGLTFDAPAKPLGEE